MARVSEIRKIVANIEETGEESVLEPARNSHNNTPKIEEPEEVENKDNVEVEQSRRWVYKPEIGANIISEKNKVKQGRSWIYNTESQDDIAMNVAKEMVSSFASFGIGINDSEYGSILKRLAMSINPKTKQIKDRINKIKLQLSLASYTRMYPVSFSESLLDIAIEHDKNCKKHIIHIETGNIILYTHKGVKSKDVSIMLIPDNVQKITNTLVKAINGLLYIVGGAGLKVCDKAFINFEGDCIDFTLFKPNQQCVFKDAINNKDYRVINPFGRMLVGADYVRKNIKFTLLGRAPMEYNKNNLSEEIISEGCILYTYAKGRKILVIKSSVKKIPGKVNIKLRELQGHLEVHGGEGLETVESLFEGIKKLSVLNLSKFNILVNINKNKLFKRCKLNKLKLGELQLFDSGQHREMFKGSEINQVIALKSDLMHITENIEDFEEANLLLSLAYSKDAIIKNGELIHIEELHIKGI